ncbi:hypothetical protein LguiB_021431 [Lonicera macranthoides]
MLLLIFYCFLEITHENLILGKNGERDENLVFRDPMFWFCRNLITSNKSLSY